MEKCVSDRVDIGFQLFLQIMDVMSSGLWRENNYLLSVILINQDHLEAISADFRHGKW